MPPHQPSSGCLVLLVSGGSVSSIPSTDSPPTGSARLRYSSVRRASRLPQVLGGIRPDLVFAQEASRSLRICRRGAERHGHRPVHHCCAGLITITEFHRWASILAIYGLVVSRLIVSLLLLFAFATAGRRRQLCLFAFPLFLLSCDQRSACDFV